MSLFCVNTVWKLKIYLLENERIIKKGILTVFTSK